MEGAAELTSPSNPRVKALVRLRTRRARDELAQTLIEGHDELRLALEAGVRPSELFYAPALIRDDQRTLADAARAAGASITSVSVPVFKKIAYRESPDGWLAVAPTPGMPLAEIEAGRNPLILVCEGIEKPGNLGAMLRTADAAGADAVISAAPVTDFGNPNAVRASKGTVFVVPVASARSEDVLGWLRQHGIMIAVTTPQGTTRLSDAGLAGPVGLVIGAESTGVTDLWLEQADMTLMIPMHGRVNSLNAATAAALALYEANRQRADQASA